MPLSDICSNAIAQNTTMGTTIRSKAIHAAVSVARRQPNVVEECVWVAVGKTVNDIATRAMRKVASKDKQDSLFGLRERYALDSDATVFKDTDRLTEDELGHVIAIREKQIADDTAHCDRLKEAQRQLRPVWRDNPGKLFGEVERIYQRRREEALTPEPVE